MYDDAPARPEDREDPETVKIILKRLETAATEPRRDDSALDEIVRKRKQQPAPR